jgi:lysophospholipase L1-like esterase
MKLSTDDQQPYVFIGDSITESGRLERSGDEFDDGYVRILSRWFATNRVFATAGPKVVNRGVGGDRVRDLQARWQQDCLELRPGLVSIAIGINDTWRCHDSGDPTPIDAFEYGYRWLLYPLHEAEVEIVLVEPFLLPISDEQRTWREDLNPKIACVRSLAVEFGATLVPADARLTACANEIGAATIAADGVHPTATGHLLLARAWQESHLLAASLA